MALIDKMKEADEQHSISEVLSSIDSLRAAVEQTLQSQKEIIDRQNELTQAMNQLSTSQPPAQPSTLPLDAVTKSRLAEIEKTLAAVAEQLSDSRVVQQSDGSSVPASSLTAYAMTSRIETAMKGLGSEIAKRKTIVFDESKYANEVDRRLRKALDESVARGVAVVAKTALAEQKEAAVELAKAAKDQTSALHETSEYVAQQTEALRAIDKSPTWRRIARLGLVLIPTAIVAVALWSLASTAGMVLGVAPVYAWAWSSFAAASTWWAKALIALATLGITTAVAWLAWLGARKLWGVLNE